MSNLIEASVFEPGIYQLETTDPVMGGANGVDNIQARQLANRTQWLKDKIDNANIETLLVRSVAVANLTANLFNVFTWDLKDIDSAGLAPDSSGGLVRVPSGYEYARVTGNLVFATNTSSAGLVGVGLLYNGSESSKYNAAGGYLRDGTVASQGQESFISSWIPVLAGDTLGMYTFQTSTGPLWSARTWMQIEFRRGAL
ncbi:MAG: hypothetical protein P1P78_11370 [Methyloprofundus sp.]|nr:hypothetical protein [Methyloprofundus sp.]